MIQLNSPSIKPVLQHPAFRAQKQVAPEKKLRKDLDSFVKAAEGIKGRDGRDVTEKRTSFALSALIAADILQETAEKLADKANAGVDKILKRTPKNWTPQDKRIVTNITAVDERLMHLSEMAEKEEEIGKLTKANDTLTDEIQQQFFDQVFEDQPPYPEQ